MKSAGPETSDDDANPSWDLASQSLPNLERLVRPMGRGLFTHELYRRLVETPVPVTRDRLANNLLQEQQIGALQFRDRRWRSAGNDRQAQDADLASISGKRFLEAIPADILPGNQPPIHEQSDRTSDVPPNGWELLRLLLPHYRERLRLAGAARLSQHVDRHRQQFELLRIRERWWPDTAGVRVLRVERRHLAPDFLKGLHQRQTDPLLLGYPMSVTRAGDDHVFIDPVAILPCAWQIDDAALLLWPTETAPTLNPDWVKKRKERGTIKSLSLWLKGGIDDTMAAQPESDGWNDLPDLLDTLRAVGSAPFLEPPDPGQTRPRLDLGADGALQNVVGLFLVGQSIYSRGTRRDISELERWSDQDFARSALSGIFASEQKKVAAPVAVVPPLPISESQYLAIRDGLSKPLTVISGPPGTGKSQVAVALMISAAADGRTVLFVSHRHQAIDAVQNRLEELVGDLPILARAYAGSKEESFSFEQAIDLILGRQIGTQARDVLKERRSQLADMGRRLDILLNDIDAYEDLGLEQAQINAELDKREAATAQRAENTQRPTASGPMQWLIRLLRRLRLKKTDSAVDLEHDISSLTINDLRHRLQQAEQQHRLARATIEKTALADRIDALCKRGRALLPILVDALHACSREDASRLVDLRGNLGLARSMDDKRRVWQENAGLVLRHFPLWACSTLAVPGRIPLVPGLFDYLIIDEATTSDIASALPLLARARNTIVIGDRLQTKMISDLPPTREAELRQRAGLDHETLGRYAYSRISLFDLMWSCTSAHPHMLRDHFRCHAGIAAYCSETFYEGRLFVRTDNSRLNPPKGQSPGLHWTHTTGPVERASNGCRSHAEAAALVDHLGCGLN